MLDPVFLRLLRCPVTGAGLVPDAGGERLTTGDGRYAYPLKGGIPDLRPARAPATQPDLHRRHGSCFRYREHYEKDAEVFDYADGFEAPGVRHEVRRLREAILRLLPRRPGLVLDVGCGSGWLAAALCPRGVRVVSVDLAPRNVRAALEATPLPNHHGLLADVFQLPFAAGAFDAVVAAEVIEHVADPGQFLESLLRVRKKEGALVVSTPYKEKRAFSLCVHCNRPTPHNAHLHSFSRTSLRAWLPADAPAGVRMVRMSSKLLALLPTHVLLRHLPYGMWRQVDRLANALVARPGRLIMRVGG